MGHAGHITLAHGSGGLAMQQFIEGEILSVFGSGAEIQAPEDQARIPLEFLGKLEGARLAFTTDSFVVDPIFFPGGDIGSLAVNGTVNDLAVGGAKPLYLSCALILEEGFALADLRKILQSMKIAADNAGVAIVTGDTKVVDRGSADKIFINTSGIGIIAGGLELSAQNVQVGDLVLINGSLGDHGATIMAVRNELLIDCGKLQSDCCSLAAQTAALLAACPNLRCMRDATRGGVASILNELAQGGKAKIQLQQSQLPIKSPVNGICELLGLDPLYLANEGKFIAIVPEAEAEAALATLHSFPEAQDAAIIGSVVETKTTSLLTMQNVFGSKRIVDLLYGEQLPRIC